MSGKLPGALPAAPPPRSGKLDSALVNLRSRTIELHDQLSELYKPLAMLRDGVGPARTASWPTFLSKFDTLCKLYFQLTKELDRAVTDVGLANFVLEPRGVAEDSGLVPELLRTKLMPEMEKELEELEEECRKVEGDGGGKVDEKVGEFNAFVDLALERFGELRDELAPDKQKNAGMDVVKAPEKPSVEQINTVLHALDKGVGLAPTAAVDNVMGM